MAYQIYQLIDDYLKYPTTVAVKLEFDSKVAFPAVTLCNLNPVLFSKL